MFCIMKNTKLNFTHEEFKAMGGWVGGQEVFQPNKLSWDDFVAQNTDHDYIDRVEAAFKEVTHWNQIKGFIIKWMKETNSNGAYTRVAPGIDVFHFKCIEYIALRKVWDGGYKVQLVLSPEVDGFGIDAWRVLGELTVETEAEFNKIPL